MLVGALGLLQTLVTMVYGAHQFFLLMARHHAMNHLALSTIASSVLTLI